ncbi:MAG: hypothetical protein ACT4PK_11625 [Gammaproteobacteria bacterium]
MQHRILAVAALSAMFVTTPVLGQGPAAAEPAAPPAEAPAPAATEPAPVVDRSLRIREIDAAIAAQNSRRKGATAGIVVGAVFVAAGVVVSALKTVDNMEEAEQEAYENGESEYTYETDTGGTLVGVLIGAPIIIGSILAITDSSRRVRALSRERSNLRFGLAPATGSGEPARLTLRYEF